MAKVKVIKNVAIGGAIHKKGSVVEVADKHAELLVEQGFAEKASKQTPLTPGGSVKAPTGEAGKEAGKENAPAEDGAKKET